MAEGEEAVAAVDERVLDDLRVLVTTTEERRGDAVLVQRPNAGSQPVPQCAVKVSEVLGFACREHLCNLPDERPHQPYLSVSLACCAVNDKIKSATHCEQQLP